MAPKTNCNPEKLKKIVTWMQKTGTCWSIKDLEKKMNEVASVNGMQAKDYLQTLSDESMIRVEKIGSGNWYWSFASQDKANKQKVLADTQAEHSDAENAVQELRKKTAEVAAQKEEEEDMLDSGEESREELNAKKVVLDADLKALQKELESYSDNDPEELERKRKEATDMVGQVEQVTDDIYSLEQWFKNNLGDDGVSSLRMGTYGDEWDTEEYEFKELKVAS